MKKTAIVLLISMLMSVVLVACGGNGNSTNNTKEDSTTKNSGESGSVDDNGAGGAYNGNWDDTTDLIAWLGEWYDYSGKYSTSFNLVSEGKAYKITNAKLYCASNRSLVDAPDTPFFTVEDIQWEDSGWGDGSQSGTVLIEEDKYAYSVYINCHDKHLSYSFGDYSSDDITKWTSCHCEGSKNKVSSDVTYYSKVSVTPCKRDFSTVLLDLYNIDYEYDYNYQSELSIYYDATTGYCNDAIVKIYCIVEKDGGQQKLKRLFETSTLGNALSNYSIDFVEQLEEWRESGTVCLTAHVDLNNCSTPNNVDHYLRGMQDIESLIKDLHKTFDNLSGEPDESLEGSNYIIDPIDMIRIEW